jgi:mannose-6-phosphate isomerase-like protein (cupin superfamily)
MPSYTRATLDELASKQYPHWIPIRHNLGIETFGMNAYRRNTGEAVVPEHDESAGGAPELFYVAEGHATFSVGGEEIDAPAGTCVWVTDADARRRATATTDDTLVLAIGGAKPGAAYTPDGWEAQYLSDES